MVALTDGVWSDQTEAISVAKKLHRQGVEVVAIGFGSADDAFLKAIASCDSNSVLTTQAGLGDAFSTIASVIGEHD